MADAPIYTLGRGAILYANTATWGSPTYAAVTDVEELSVEDAMAVAEIKSRSNPVVLALAGSESIGISFSLIFKSADARQRALRDAFRARTPIELWAATGVSTLIGVEGPHAEWLIVEFGRNEPLDDGVKISVKALPHALAANAFEWKTVSA